MAEERRATNDGEGGGEGDPHREGAEEPARGTSENGEPDPDVEGPTPDSEREERADE
jgi:hypothetical protein